MPTLYWQDPSGQTISVTLDATTNETHEDLVTITSHPVERGVNISDHARDEPISLMVEGLVTNVPLARIPGVQLLTHEHDVRMPADPGTQEVRLEYREAPVTAATFTVGGLIDHAFKRLPKTATARGSARLVQTRVRSKGYAYEAPGRNRPKEVYELLLEAKAQKALITVTTPLRDYADLLLQRIATMRSPADGQAARFQLDLMQIRIASSQTVKAPVPAEARGNVKRNSGAQQTSKKPAESEAPLESTLHKILF